MISGPLSNNWEASEPQLTVLETNEIQPARVRCQATSLDRLGACSPDSSLIVTGQKQFTPECLYGARDSFYSRNGDISYNCENNYIMEYEYLITSNASKINRCVSDNIDLEYRIADPTDLPSPRAYMLINITKYREYGTTLFSSTTPAPTTTSTHISADTTTSLSAHISADSAIDLYPATIIIILLLFMITPPLTVGFLYMRSNRRLNTPQCVQTVEKTLVIKVEQPVASESAAVREKETSFSENSDSSRSSIQAQLQEKLPDTISSRSKTL